MRAEVYVRQNNKRVFVGRAPFGRYLTTENAITICNLKPGAPCRIHLYLWRRNDVKPWRKIFDFTPVKQAAKIPLQPRILTVGPGKSYRTVGAALEKARSGDTILISPGTYGEMLTVRRDDITIRGTVPGKVKLSAEFMFDHIIRGENIRGLTIENIDFIGLRYSAVVTGVTLHRSEKIKLKNCRFLAINERRTGNLHFYGTALKDVEITNCVFERAFQCIWITNSSGYVKINHNTFSRSGINAMHLGGGPGAELTITNNLIQDVVGNHNSPAISVGDPRSRVVCDWNLYWNTRFSPRQMIYGAGGERGIEALEYVLLKNMCKTIEETRKRYKIEKNGLYADPKLKDPKGGDLTLAPDSPARGRASDGKDLGADMRVFSRN